MHIFIHHVGGRCQGESDPATCFLGDLATFSTRKTSKRDVNLLLKSLMYSGIFTKPGYVTKQALAPCDN